MKAKTLIVMTIVATLAGGSSIAQAALTSGIYRDLVPCEDKLESQEKKNDSLQCELDYFECVAGGKGSSDCKAAQYICELQGALNADRNHNGIIDDSTLDGGRGEDYLQNQKDPDSDHVAHLDNYTGLAGQKVPSCEDKLDGLKKENKTLQCEIDCFESSTNVQIVLMCINGCFMASFQEGLNSK